MKKNIATILIALVLFVPPTIAVGNASIALDRGESYYIDSPSGNSYCNSINYLEGNCLTGALGAGRRVFKYVYDEIDLDKLIYNLKYNARDYVKHMRFGQYESNAFFASLDKYLQALDEGRLYMNVPRVVTDSRGLLTNDPVNYLYNGHYISQTQYSYLSNGQKKKCSQGFYPNKEVARYINRIAELMIEKEKEEQKNNAVASSSLRVYNGYQYSVVDYFSDGRTSIRGTYQTSVTITLDLSKKVIKFVVNGSGSTYNIIDEPYSSEVDNVVYICSVNHNNSKYAISFFNDGEILCAPLVSNQSYTMYSYKVVRVQ